ncbi:MAG: hypothetical protein ACK4NF_07735, partial [Planctomycetota bacterium]
ITDIQDIRKKRKVPQSILRNVIYITIIIENIGEMNIMNRIRGQYCAIPYTQIEGQTSDTDV